MCLCRKRNVMLTVGFGHLKFHHYMYGREFICKNGHDPLENIHLKHLNDTSPNLQKNPSCL